MQNWIEVYYNTDDELNKDCCSWTDRLATRRSVEIHASTPHGASKLHGIHLRPRVHEPNGWILGEFARSP